MATVVKTQLSGLRLASRGKVRDIYELGERLLIVTTDRISAFDSVLPTPIPGKGRVLTQLSAFWFRKTESIVPNHLITTEISEMDLPRGLDASGLSERTMLVKRAKPLPVECVARGYVAGSGWLDYQKTGTICGIDLPPGLRQAERLPEPIFTPATKAETGHDINIDFATVEDMIGKDLAARIRDLTLRLYLVGHDHARARGIILADTKFEMGISDGELIVIDEMLTPDSSRFWDASTHSPGASPPSFDKQFVRDYLIELGWNREPPAPELPEEVVRMTSEKYEEALRRLTAST